MQSRVSTARLLAARFDAYKRKNVMHDNAGLVEVETDKDEEERDYEQKDEDHEHGARPTASTWPPHLSEPSACLQWRVVAAH